MTALAKHDLNIGVCEDDTIMGHGALPVRPLVRALVQGRHHIGSQRLEVSHHVLLDVGRGRTHKVTQLLQGRRVAGYALPTKTMRNRGVIETVHGKHWLLLWQRGHAVSPRERQGAPRASPGSLESSLPPNHITTRVDPLLLWCPVSCTVAIG
jgi:hypothetical protein